MLHPSNRLKSTEKLIESDASTEEALVPALDLSICRQSIGSTFSESSPITTDKKQRVVVVDRVDIHQSDEHHATAPIPAARSSLVSGPRKTKETSIVEVQNEKMTLEKIAKPLKRTVESQAMNLIDMTPEIKPRIKKKIFADNGDLEMDETTSFITHEGRHEMKDVNEKEMRLQSDSDGTQCTNLSKQSAVNIANMSPGKKKLSDEEVVTSAEKHVKNEAPEEHKDGTISITLHNTTPLRFDASIRSPRVRISIYDLTTGNMLHDEPTISHCSRLKESNELECVWSKKPVHIDEDMHTIRNGNAVFFFELVDNAPASTRNKRNKNASTDGAWLQICWAFLKPCDVSNTFYNVGIKCCLQLYEYQRMAGKNTIFEQWKMRKKLYQGLVSVTLNEHDRRRSQMRIANVEQLPSESMHMKSSEIHFNETKLLAPTTNGISNDSWTRLPGQLCKCPNVIVYQHPPIVNSNCGDQQDNSGGSMVAQFNPSGTLLAFQSNAKHTHEISVLLLTTMKVTLNLSGHRSVVYDLCWLDDTILVSASSDCTVIVWFLQKKYYSMRVVPHPSFVYAVRFLNFRAPASDEYSFIATGGRDCVLRIWRVLRTEQPDDSDRAAIDLCDEYDDHQNYITSLAVTKRATTLYSADWNGEIFEWRRRQSAKYNLDTVYKMRRKLKSFPFSVSKIELDAKGQRLYAQGVNDPFIHSIEITSGIVVQSIGEPHAQCTVGRQTFAFSTCGSLLFIANADPKITCWSPSNDDDVNTLKLPIVGGRAFISSLIYHASKFWLACTVYGDTKGTSLLLLGHEKSNETHQPLQTIQNEKIELQTKVVPVPRTFGTFGNILSRIDDLFALAMKSTNCTDDYKQRKQLEISLQQLEAPSHLLSSDLNGSEVAIDSTNSIEAERSPKIDDHTDSSSTQSNHTFTLKTKSKSDDDHTFIVENSDQNSNATFGIENECKSPGRDVVNDKKSHKKHEIEDKIKC